ncbi:hypothetical protein [Mycoplasma elephantis]|uniref:hypothetical protein n=1 Tax=Mycoplasma elephantis TaxID=114882 RepID=UPI000487E39E|nr:hypothetical protein [Mycoplasma elephantis]
MIRYKDYYVAYDKNRKNNHWVIYKDNPNGMEDFFATFKERTIAIAWLLAQNIGCRVFFEDPNDGLAGVLYKKENSEKYSVNFVINYSDEIKKEFISAIGLNEDKTISIRKQNKILGSNIVMKIKQELKNYDLKILDKNFDGKVKKDCDIRIIDGTQIYYQDLNNDNELSNYKTKSSFVSDDILYNTTPTKDDQVDPTNICDINEIQKMYAKNRKTHKYFIPLVAIGALFLVFIICLIIGFC